MNIFTQSKYLDYYDKVAIDHDNIKKNKLTQLLFNSYYFFFHEKKNSLTHKTPHLILGSNIFLNLLLSYKIAYLEIINNQKDFKKIKTISLFFDKNMDFWNYNIPLTPIFIKMLQSKLKQFDMMYNNVLSNPQIKNIQPSYLFEYVNNENNLYHLDNKKLIQAFIKDLDNLNIQTKQSFIKLVNIDNFQVYNSFNVQNICKKIGPKNDNYIYNNILRLAHKKEVEKLQYPQEYEYLKENIKRVNAYNYLFNDFEISITNSKTLKPFLIQNVISTICPDYNILTYYLLVENLYITSSTNLHPWANIKMLPTYETQDLMSKSLYEFSEEQTQLVNNELIDNKQEKSTHQAYQDKLITEIKNTYFDSNGIESMQFDYFIKVANSNSKFNYYGSAKKIANNPYSFMAQPLLDLDKIF